MATNIKHVEVAGVVHKIEDATAREQLDAIKSTEVTATTPTSDNTQVWINPESEESFSVPEIKDNTINSTDTWSSTKINSELESLKNNINDNTEYMQKYTVLVDENLTDSGKAADAKITGDKISSLKEDISNKITKFYASNQGETHITDSDNGKIMDMMLYGKSAQDGTPSLENPVEIKSVVNPTVKVCGKNLLNSTLQTMTQNGVTCINNGDGTYTLNGTAKLQTVFNLFNINENIYGGKLITGCQPGGGRNTFNIVIVYYTKDRKWASEDYEVGDGKIIKIKNESSYLLVLYSSSF